MGLFNLFKKTTPKEKLRKSLRKGVEAAVSNALRECNNDQFFAGMMVQVVIASYFERIKSSDEYAAIALMSTMSETWNADQVVDEEYQRALNKYLNLKSAT